MLTSQANQATPHPESSEGVAPKKLSPKTVVGAIVAALLVAALGLFLMLRDSSTGNAVGPQRSSTQKVDDARWWEVVAQKSQGDFNQLNTQDQKKAVILASNQPNAQEMLTQTYRNLTRNNAPVGHLSAPPPRVMVTPCETMRQRYPNEYAKARQDGTCP